jgi:hypothetical protein
MSFSKSIGGSTGSGSINTSSVGLSQASGGPVGGYATPNSGTGPGAPPHTGESQHSRKPTPRSSAEAAQGKKADSARSGSGKIPAPSKIRM